MVKKKTIKEFDEESCRFFFSCDSWLTRWIHFKSNSLGLKPSSLIRMIVTQYANSDYEEATKERK